MSSPVAAPSLLVLIPAHNEARSISAAVASVRHVGRVLVVADNCTDDTAVLARAAGAEVFQTRDNTARKAGALNQALDTALPGSTEPYVLVLDADSVLGPGFVTAALTRFRKRADLGAVGGVFYGAAPRGWLQQAQANEFQRYSRTVAQRRDRVSVLTGTASMFRREALLDLSARRGYVYDPAALTEDNEVTLALKTAGWAMTSPVACRVETELMPSWRALRVQRLRWYRGAIDNLLGYGWTPVTRRYWGQQLGLLASTLAMGCYLSLTVFAITLGTLHFSVLWTLVGIGFWAERLITVWSAGRRARLLAALFVPETIYDVFLQVVFLQALWSVLTRRRVAWHHPALGEEG